MVVFTIKPGGISLKDISSILNEDKKIQILPESYTKIRRSHEIVQEVLEKGEVVYGINTGFGQLANKRIDHDQLQDLQRRIILSHASGVGKLLDKETVKLIMLLKINSLARGYSGISVELVDKLIELYNSDIIPCIPEQGSVGASGDLAPLAHMSMALIGEGEVLLDGKKIKTISALEQKNIKPIILQEKEGLSLINGTQVSTAIAIMGLLKMQRNFAIATISGGLGVDAIAGSIKPFDEFIGVIKNCEGQVLFSKVIRELLDGSQILAGHKNCDRVQDPYSIRCQPQVMGAVLNYMHSAEHNLIKEANGVSDNPLIDFNTKSIVSGGNFHAELTGFSADMLGMICSEIGAISERRIALLIDSNMSGLPAFLVNNPGINSGFMMAHVTASSLASENKTLAHPASVDSLPTSANQEDHVSMATFASVKLHKIADNVLNILAVETLATCQGVDFRKPLKTSNILQSKIDMLRGEVPFYDEDRYFAEDIEKCAKLISNSNYYKEIQEKLFYV